MKKKHHHSTPLSTSLKCVLGALLSFTAGELTASAKFSFATRHPSNFKAATDAKLVDIFVTGEKYPYNLFLELDAKADLIGMRIVGGPPGTEDLHATIEELEEGFPLKKAKKIITVTKLTAHEDFSTQTGGMLDLMIMRYITNKPDLLLEMVRNINDPKDVADDTWELYAHFPEGPSKRSPNGPVAKLPRERVKINQLYFAPLVSEDEDTENLDEGPISDNMNGIKLVGGSLDNKVIRIMNTGDL